MPTIETTNEKLEHVQAEIKILIQWAEADAEHAAENDAPYTSRDDKIRARILHRALALLDTCRR